MNSRWVSSHTALATFLMLIGTIVSTACGESSGQGAPSILDVKADAVRVRLLDASTGRPIANADVKLRSDNGVRCIQPPCPTNVRQWTGRTDAAGGVIVPTRILQPVTTINASRYEGDLISDSEPGDSGRWEAELFARDTTGSSARPIKLIDSRSHKAISNLPVRVEFRTDGGRRESFRAMTNPRGYVFVPFEIVARAGEQIWVVIPGYRRTHLDFAWARHRTVLQQF
jgi:hypothetical protein